ncbi:hypothetical protein ACFWNT_41895 [Streptomyces sp. NPDC058409]|uniref:hypothetical protein n=1 Tax=Streptomyces sp. NPDC058409 TaxID=3346484 RepID=UPI00364B6604
MTAPADPRLALDNVLDLGTALDLVAAKTELLGECKLEYPQDYAPGDAQHMTDEIKQLRRLRTRLMNLQARRAAAPSV